ncbi:MAG: alanine racemase [Rhodoglobus sp.]
MTGMRVATVDRGALRHNIGVLSQRVAPAALMVIVKADAYGHGAVEVARVAVECGIRHLGALDLGTGLRLREAGIPRDVVVLAWHFGPDEVFGEAIVAGVSLGVSQLSELDRIEKSNVDVEAFVHLKIDTGLRRNGATAEDWPGLVQRALDLQARGIVRIIGVWTHIAEASEEEDTEAVRRFDAAIAVAEALGARFELRHLAASSAGFRRDDVRFDLVRMGGHVWGIPSFDGITASEMGLRPVMTLSATITAIEPIELASGEQAQLAEVPLGFVDGIPRNVAGAVSVAVNGKRYPIDREIGHSSFLLEVDEGVRVGDSAGLFGSGDHGEQTVREWGDLTDTLGDEIVARLGSRIDRIYVDRD